ncbi:MULTISPECIES: hypothetical protein [Bacteria]|jgi:hypothetical protein|uniref:Antitoxin of toxin-antitoxin stability system n=3 Tax=Sphingomonas TaxID=13687 RepID=A0A0D1MEI6_9SPHN|nr:MULTISPECIES: hypothetical protein [Bacteria]KIU26091.1 antitoxin of toxin-antitoxin stability system [Sphingomonas melonis]MBB4049230.1 hypothetical protein [Sphingomonas zeae]MBB4610475.1 hypothetical protein [Sphingomonas yabuuchiae]MBN3557578.1 antitoxin of toxin-antitoxin stability system [Sphingomonas yabuuchiae]NUU48135.1 antitoxin of toxin-antitoxin stability system [Sphingomonas zeae]
MPELVITRVFRPAELEPPARDTARAWARHHLVPDDWHESVFEDFENVCAIVGVEIATRPVRLYGGGTRAAPRILFSGFASQGDGASFEGEYRYARGSSAAIRSYAPVDPELHRIVDALAAIQRRNLYQLQGTIRQTGRYCHEYSMTISVERDGPNGQDGTPTAEDDVTEALRDLARWLYRRLEAEYDFQTADHQVDAALEANDVTFTAAGAKFP